MGTENFKMCKLGFKKAEEPEIKLPTSIGSKKKQEFQKNIYFWFTDYTEAFVYVYHNKLWKTLKEMWIPDHLTCLPRNSACVMEGTIVLISHATRVMLKILQASLQQYMNCELPDVQAGFRKGRGTRDQIANIHWIMEKARSSRKTSISAWLTMPKPLTVWITTNCGKFWKRWEYHTTCLPPEKSVCRSRSNN